MGESVTMDDKKTKDDILNGSLSSSRYSNNDHRRKRNNDRWNHQDTDRGRGRHNNDRCRDYREHERNYRSRSRERYNGHDDHDRRDDGYRRRPSHSPSHNNRHNHHQQEHGRYNNDRRPPQRHHGGDSHEDPPSVRPPPQDPKLGTLQDDPRGPNDGHQKRITRKASTRGNGRNTESFDPKSTLIRPDLRIQVGSKDVTKFNKVLKHDDVVIVPDLFGPEDDWGNYYILVEEMRQLQKVEKDKTNDESKGKHERGKGGGRSSEWISWHEGAHLISQNPSGSKLFESIKSRLCEYFNIDQSKPVGTRFNWYRDSGDWKPFHHDSAAFNPNRAKNQNITVGASFGASRELAFIRADEGVTDANRKCRLYFPQMNNGVFSFGRDSNILWKHGVNALPEEEQDGKGRISIILWGLAKDVVEEKGSPPLLGSDGQGPHAQRQGQGRRRGGRGGDRRERHGGDHRDLGHNRKN